MTQAFNLSQFANYLNTSGQVSNAGLQTPATTSIPSGSVVLFYQSAAPTGWTQVTSLNDYDLRLVSGAGGSTGGTTAYSSVFTNQTPSISVGGLSAGATTLSTAMMPSHNHLVPIFAANSNRPYGYACLSGAGAYLPNENTDSRGCYTSSTGSGNSHSHSISGSASSSAITLNVRYANIIICSKN
jgi:hypothetical protein